MEKDKEKLTVNVVNDRGASMMSISQVTREGEQLAITGSLLGAWESTMYLEPEVLLKMVRLLLKKEIIGYMISALFLIRKRKKLQAES
jgi:hypothetical protein